MPFLYSPSRIINPLAHERRFGFGSGMSGGESFTGPLDAYTTNLVDAFSAEYRLLTAYTGGLHLVRASTGGAETPIGVTASGRFDTAAWTAHVGAGQGFGVSWLNQVSGGSNFTQTSDATRQGEILLNQVNGGAVLKLDATNDGYPSIRTVNRPFTIFLVELGVPNGARRSLNSSSVNSVLSTQRNAASCFIAGGAVSNYQASNSVHIGEIVAPSGIGATYLVDGVDRTTTSTNTNNWGALTLGNVGVVAEAGETCLCEILIYNTDLDSSTRAAIRAILKNLRNTP